MSWADGPTRNGSLILCCGGQQINTTTRPPLDNSHLPRYARPAPAAITPRATTAHVRVRGLHTSLPRMTLPFINTSLAAWKNQTGVGVGTFWIEMRNRDTCGNNPRARKVCSGVRGEGGKSPARMGGLSIPGSRLGYGGVWGKSQVLRANEDWGGGGWHPQRNKNAARLFPEPEQQDPASKRQDRISFNP